MSSRISPFALTSQVQELIGKVSWLWWQLNDRVSFR